MTHDELIEAAGLAIEEQLTAEDGWEVGTPQLKRMCQDFARAAISVIAAAVLDEAAKVADEYAVFHAKHDDGLSGFDYMASGAREVAENIRDLKTRYE